MSNTMYHTAMPGVIGRFASQGARVPSSIRSTEMQT